MALEDIAGLKLQAERDANAFTDPQVQSALQQCREIILDSFAENFRDSASPTASWPPRKDDLPHPLLIKTGALERAATGRGPGHVTVWLRNGFYVGVDTSVGVGGVPAAAAHNFGAPALNLPQREFLAARQDAEDRCEEILADALFGEADG